MSTKKKVQIIAIVFLVIAVLLLVPNTDWSKNISIIGFISLVCGTLGSVISIFIPTNYVFNYQEKDWISEGKQYKIIITSKKHGLGTSPKLQMFTLDGDSYNEAICGSNHNSKGDITVYVNRPYIGKFIVS
jgi:hypothetical protein